jgi:Zn-finger nucleic acid-binding protein
MKCPHCKTPDLQPTMIEDYLPGMGCGTCHGSLVSLLTYRYWAETQKGQTGTPAPSAVVPETTDTTTAVTCPKCERVMMKYKLTGRVSNRVDVCNTCDEAWLDGGEWELLEALQLSHKMPSIFTDAWQRRIRHELSEETRRSILARTVGDEAAARIEEFKAWLATHKHKSFILTYLYKS